MGGGGREQCVNRLQIRIARSVLLTRSLRTHRQTKKATYPGRLQGTFGQIIFAIKMINTSAREEGEELEQIIRQDEDLREG